MQFAQDSVARGIGLERVNFDLDDLAGAQGCGEGGAQIFDGYGICHGDVEKGAERSGGRYAVDDFDFGWQESRRVEHKRLGYGRATAEVGGEGHVDARWHRISELVERKRGLVAEDALRLILAIAGPEPPNDEVWAGGERVGGETEDSAVLAGPVTNVYMVVALGRGVAERGGLLGREEPVLRCRKVNERALILDIGPSLHNGSALLNYCAPKWQLFQWSFEERNDWSGPEDSNQRPPDAPSVILNKHAHQWQTL
jgi:hypothetical protein